MSEPSAGLPSWQVNPDDPAQVRWWDGDEWTEHVKHAPRSWAMPMLRVPRKLPWTISGVLLGLAVVAFAVAVFLAVTSTDEIGWVDTDRLDNALVSCAVGGVLALVALLVVGWAQLVQVFQTPPASDADGGSELTVRSITDQD